MFDTYRRRLPFTTADRMVIFFSLILTLATVLIVPLAGILYFSFASSYPVMGEYSFTVEHYVTLFSDIDLMVDLTRNSLYYAIGATTLSLAIGLTAAFLEVKYVQNRWFRILMLLPYGFPSVASLTGWIILLGNNGLLTNLAMDTFNLSQPPFDVFTIYGMFFTTALHTAPITFILLSPAIRSIPAAVDEAALSSGASKLTMYRKILIPLIIPSVISVAIYLFVRALTAVVTPGILGVPKSIFTWGSAIPFLFLSGSTLSYNLALSFSVFMTIVTGILMIYYYFATSKAAKYTTVTGKGGAEAKEYEAGRVGTFLIWTFFVGYLFVAGLLPLVTIIWDSVLPSFHFTLDTSVWTLEYYTLLLNDQTQRGDSMAWWRSLKNTVVIAFVVPTLSMLVAFFVSYANRMLNISYSGLISYLASAPLAIPSLTIGLGFLIVYLRTPLYGTVVLLFGAFLARTVPVAMRYTSPAVTKLGQENIEAANICGYREIRSYLTIVFPLTIDDFIAGWMHTFVTSVRNVAIPILLYTTGSEVVAVELLQQLRASNYKTASAMAVLITALTMVPYIFLQWWRTQRDVSR